MLFKGKESDNYNCIGVMTMVYRRPNDAEDLEITLLGAVYAMGKSAAAKHLLDMVDDYIQDNGPIPENCEIRLDFTNRIIMR